jgi:hypothetical protein
VLNNRNRPPFAQSKRVKVHRARRLSDKLSSLPDDELRLLRKFIKDPIKPGIQQILAKPVLAEYTIQELRVALSILSGIGEVPSPDPGLIAGKVEIRERRHQPKTDSVPSVSLIDDQNSQTPYQIKPHIVQTLSMIPDEDILHLAEHIRNPTDPRSRFLMIRYHLYRFSREDLAINIASLLRLRKRPRAATRKHRTPRVSLSSPRFH